MKCPRARAHARADLLQLSQNRPGGSVNTLLKPILLGPLKRQGSVAGWVTCLN